jgi:hypothetical protein
VFIHKPPYDSCGYRVWFRVGVQYFRIGDIFFSIDFDNLEQARWHAKLFCRALGRFKELVDHGEKDEKPD